MTPRIPLPDEFHQQSFDAAMAHRAGLTQGRLRRKDLRRPFRGIRSTRDALSTADRCRDYAPRLKAGQFFTHHTAAVLLGMPVPLAMEQDEAVHVGACRPADAPHADGVVGHRLLAPARVTDSGGLPVVDAPEVFCQLGAFLDLEDLVVIADHLLNTTELDEQVAKERLLERIHAIRRIGRAKLVRAVRYARRGSRSPAETRIRLMLEAANLPTAELNTELFDARGRSLGSPDFVWRAQRVVLEYEGDGHRQRDQFRYDIRRYEALGDAGWRVLRATGDDLTPDGRRALVDRVRAALR